jgi:hypothetical protein
MDVGLVYKHGEQRACGTAVDSRVFVVSVSFHRVRARLRKL